MLGEPCKVCGAPVDMPRGKLCRKCYNAHQKALPGYQKNLQEKTWKNTPSRQKRDQEKAWKNQPWYKKNLQEKTWKNTPSRQKRDQEKAWKNQPWYQNKTWKNTPSYQKRLQEKTWKNTPSYQNKTWKNTPSYQKRLQEKAWGTYPKACEACGSGYEAYHKYSRLCPVCYARQLELKTASKTDWQYKRLRINGRQILEHRYLAEEIFGRELTLDEHIHHLDGDPRHNELSNLIILSNSNHHRLHKYLEVQQVVEEQHGNPKPWSELVVPLSLQWLRVNKIPCLRLSNLKAFKDWLLIPMPGISSQSGYFDYLIDGYCQLYLYPDLYRVAEWVAGDSPLAEVV